MKHLLIYECDNCGDGIADTAEEFRRRDRRMMRRQMTPEWHQENMWFYCGGCGETHPLRVQWYEMDAADAATVARMLRIGLDVRPMLTPVT